MNRRIFGSAVAVAFCLTAGAAYAATHDRFRTEMSGQFEVPVRTTEGEGHAKFKVSDDGMSIEFKLEVEDITNVWMSHIHVAPVGANGPIVVWLFPSAPPPPATAIAGEFDGRLAEGEITAANLVGPLAGKPLSALLDAMRAGNTYVNVHTNDFIDPPNTGPGDFPGGEIRGQIHAHH